MSFRIKSDYENLSQKFLLKSHDYQKQYSHLYAARLNEMTRLLKPLAEKKWGPNVPIRKLCDLREEQDEESCIIIGTIYKHQAYKPSILREISEENQLAPQPQRENFCDSEDKLILEDELQRVRLQGIVDASIVGTGAVCAVYGMIEEGGRFEVEDVIYFEGGPQRPIPNIGMSRFLVLVSGINLKSSSKYLDSLNIFQHWLCGNLKGPRNSCQNIVRVIFAGNTVSTTSEAKVPAGQLRPQESNNDIVEYIVMLDEWLAALAKSVEVDIMPGDCDPANYMLPQQPFHPCMFPNAARNKAFRSVPNPYKFRIDGLDVLGCSGQNVKDLMRTTQVDDTLEALKSTLIWSHLAPTAPDTLSCYPHINYDPFIIDECPHIYFAGNCDKFRTSSHQGSNGQNTRLICVPNFSKTQTIALVDLETLDCHEMYFGSEELSLDFV